MTDARDSVVSAEGVSFSHGEPPFETKVLHDVSVAIRPGELTVLMGPSGSGKTTLISILAGLVRPRKGRVVLCGEELTKMSDAKITAARRRSLGFVFQAFHLFPALSATDNVAEVLALTGVPIRTARERARALLTRFELGQRLDNLPGQLSAGQRQRVAIARALCTRPKVVIADEPTVALDSATARAVMSLLREYITLADAEGEGAAVLLVTHDSRLVEPGDRVVSIEDGQVARDVVATEPARNSMEAIQ
ncbi:MAG: ABC transporter ATP-binding protein [Sandaracinaceae bacterium]